MRGGMLIACLAAAACGSRQLNPPPADPACTHPCDLAQSIQIDVVGAEPAASVTVTEPCGGGVADCGPSGCRMVNIYLSSGLGEGDATLVCHLTAVAPSGRVVERDLTARYTGSFCCPGYEFGWGLSIDIDFSASDAGGGDGPAD